jgi:hypothetical protein
VRDVAVLAHLAVDFQRDGAGSIQLPKPNKDLSLYWLFL